jgi:hypothetical protein
MEETTPRPVYDCIMLHLRMLPLQQNVGEITTRSTRVRLPRRGRLAMNVCGARETTYLRYPNRMDTREPAEIIMGNHQVNRRLNLREKKRESAVSALANTLYPQERERCLGSADRCRRKVDPYDYRRKSEMRNVVNPICPIKEKMETRPQGRAMTKRAKDVGKSESGAVMVSIGRARMERPETPRRKAAHFRQVYFGNELMNTLINHSGVNRR